MNTNEVLARLETLRNQSGEAHFERISLSKKLLENKEWVEAVDGGGGDEVTAIKLLEDVYLADICGLVSLTELFDVLTEYPTYAQWKKYKFNFRSMWAELSAARRPKQSKRKETKAKGGFVSPEDFPECTPNIQRKEYERSIRALDSRDQRIEYLERENEKLKEDNRNLRTELAGMRSRVKQILSA